MTRPKQIRISRRAKEIVDAEARRTEVWERLKSEEVREKLRSLPKAPEREDSRPGASDADAGWMA